MINGGTTRGRAAHSQKAKRSGMRRALEAQAASGGAVGTRTLTEDRDTGRDNMPKWRDPGFWTARGCVTTGGVFVPVLGIGAAVQDAIDGYTEGLTASRNQPGVRRRGGSQWETLHADGPRGLL